MHICEEANWLQSQSVRHYNFGNPPLHYSTCMAYAPRRLVWTSYFYSKDSCDISQLIAINAQARKLFSKAEL